MAIPEAILKKTREAGAKTPQAEVEISELDTAGKLDKAKTIPRKHLAVIDSYIKRGKKGQAYSSIYPQTTQGSAYQLGSRLLKKYEWVLEALYESAGITPRHIARGIKANMADKSGKVRNTALKLGMELLKLGEGVKEKATSKETLVIIKDKAKGVFALKMERR